MEMSELTINLFGPPGSGKTTNTEKLFMDHAAENGVKHPKILVLDFDKDHRAKKNIKTHFNQSFNENGESENFKVLEILQRIPAANNSFERTRKSNLFNDLPGNKFKVGYYESYSYLRDNVLKNLDELLSDVNYCMVDKYFPVIRKKLGIAQFFHENPNRKNAVKEDYTDINPIETQVYDAIQNACQDNGVGLVFTGIMETDYDTKKPVFSYNDIEVLHAASLNLELVSPEITKTHKRPAITVNCHKSTRSFTWSDEITLDDPKAAKEEDKKGRSLYQILYDRYEID
jgi:GTPase SAR1 family protein